MAKSENLEKIHKRELKAGERFEFGENWSLFLDVLDEQRIDEAVDSLKIMLDVNSLKGRSFLDIGSGSGLFSLAAKKLGAKVHSFDYDPKSVACTKELKNRFFANDEEWIIEIGSALDANYLEKLGKFDIVYSWGVLHHTGDMWKALDCISQSVNVDGKLFIALYNDQGRPSQLWWKIKKTYVSLPKYMRWLVLMPCYVRLWLPTTIRDMVLLKPFKTWTDYKQSRGMSPHRDVIDWVGGFPFEVAKPEEIFKFFKEKGFLLTTLKTCAGGHGCNEYVFELK